MYGLKALLAAAPLLALAIAQNVAFTSVPAIAEAGESYNITWGGGDGTSVTLTLRRGDPNDLSTVGTLADAISGTSYLWTVSRSLPEGDDYALQITQGQSDINYSGLFTITGGSNSTSSSSRSSTTGTRTATGNATVPMTASASGTGTAVSRNTTFSTASLTASSTEFGSGTSTFSRTSAAATSQSTSAPSNDAPAKFASFGALALGILGAVILQ